jgi:hypothetical protein
VVGAVAGKAERFGRDLDADCDADCEADCETGCAESWMQSSATLDSAAQRAIAVMVRIERVLCIVCE